MINISILRSTFYEEISNNLLEGVTNSLKTIKKIEDQKYEYNVFDVFGALELPILLNHTIDDFNENFSSQIFIILGCVIRGETDHYDHVSRIVMDKIYDIACESYLPIGSAIITAHSYDKALERSKTMGSHALKGALSLYRTMQD